MKQRGISDVQDRLIDERTGLAAALQYSPPKQGSAPQYVLWLDQSDLADLQIREGADRYEGRIYLSSTLLGDALPSSARRVGGEVYAVHLFDLPDNSARRFRALDVWMHSKKIAVTDAPLQANTLFAATLAAQALKHIGSNFYRDYFIERIEHIFDSMVTPSAYPRLGLGPNQRFASKGGYVLRLPTGAPGDFTQGQQWIVP
jgi:hypothetical protein